MKICNDLCDILGVDIDELIQFSSSSPYRYKVYSIKKRNGSGHRIIAHPSKELKFVQRCLIIHLSKILPIHRCSFAYKKNVSIKHNAMEHMNNSYLLKMDFKNFFPSITPEQFLIATARKNINFNELDSKILSSILFWKPKRDKELVLSIGAPSSPLISNFIMYDFDEFMFNYCEQQKIKYTRYADDITFSTNIKGILFNIPEIVIGALKTYFQNSIEINSAKTVFTSKKHNRHVTGVTITNNNTLSIGRSKKRNISASIHKFKTVGLSGVEARELQGLVSYASYIEAEFEIRMIKKYGKETLEKLRKYKNIE